MNNNELYQMYLQQIAQQEQNRPNAIDNLKSYTSKINNFGNNLSSVGNAIQNNINNEAAKNIGASMMKTGNTLSGGASTVTNALNTPQNYFKGFANQNIGSGLTQAGEYLANKTGIANALGTGLKNIGASMTGTMTGGAAGLGAGAGAGATAAGTGAAASGAAAGSAAGGAAAGSGAAGAAAAGPIGALVALGAMALSGGNRKKAKQQSQSLLNATNEQAQGILQEADQSLAQTQQNAQALQDQSNQAMQTLQNADGSISAFPTTKEQFSQSLKYNGWDDNSINSALNGLNLGNKEMADYINLYNQTAGKDQQINIPQTDEEIANARALISGNNQQTGQVATTQNVKQGILDKFINGLSDLSKGYQENKYNSFKPENLTQKQFMASPDELQQQGNNKGAMARIGEAAGTLSRIAQKPALQALIAGGLSTALTGNPLYGLGMADKYGGMRARTNAYQEALNNNGIQYDPGLFGKVDNSDFNALMTPKYKEAVNNLAMAKLNEQQNYHDLMMKYYNDKLDETRKKNEADISIKQQNANSSAIKANAAAIKAQNGGSARSGKTGATKPQQHQDWNSDLAGFTQILTNPKYADKVDVARARFIDKYGVDPMKSIKM